MNRTDTSRRSALHLVVNGERREHRGNGSLTALLKEIGIGSNPAAVLVNDAVVISKDRRRTRLKTGDRVEVLTFVGGG